MNRELQLAFVSDEALNRHLEHLTDLKLKYSVLEKSYPILLNADIQRVKYTRLDRAAKSEAIDLIVKIKSHECYFDSFCLNPKPYKPIKRYFSSEDAFVYEMFSAAKNSKEPFIYVYKDRYGTPFVTDRYYGNPIFAVDLSEHAYFLDYGFSREEYLRRALGYLDLGKLSIEALDKASEK